ncbi:hypothetical protein [Streptomyces sp. NPDC056632]|uniref:hypothetical protein n=1 Tax=Streptomyces sp. NPDC056632 TaxID=3345884 RepID=UPI00369390E6
MVQPVLGREPIGEALCGLAGGEVPGGKERDFAAGSESRCPVEAHGHAVGFLGAAQKVVVRVSGQRQQSVAVERGPREGSAELMGGCLGSALIEVRQLAADEGGRLLVDVAAEGLDRLLELFQRGDDVTASVLLLDRDDDTALSGV